MINNFVFSYEQNLSTLKTIYASIDNAEKYSGIIANVYTEEFHNSAGSSTSEHSHHDYRGGLGEHTLEVLESSIEMADFYNLEYAEKRNLFFAALFHDYGKIFDYAWDGDNLKWVKTAHAKKIHHISRSAIKWQETAKDFNYPESGREEVLHAILAHHQLREWGSPVEPQTKIAWILHNCDNMSARIDQLSK